MKTKTNVKAGGLVFQHNQISAALKVKSSVKASGPGPFLQHNQSVACVRA